MKNTVSKLFFVFMLLSVTQLSEICYAQYLPGPVSQALGGSGRGAADEGEQILLNPATIVHASAFTSSFIYNDGYTDHDEHDRVLGLTLADNSEELFFSGGYAYFNRRMTFANFSTIEQQYHQVSIGRYIFKHFSMGATVLYSRTDLVGGKTFDQWDGHIGFHYNPDPDFGLGLVFYNVANRNLDAPIEIQNLDKITLGVHYIFMPMFRVRFDVSQQQVVNPSHKFQFQTGVESRFSDYLMARLGWDTDKVTDRDFYSIGLGFDGPKLKIDYFYRKNSDYSGAAMHGVDMRMPFW